MAWPSTIESETALFVSHEHHRGALARAEDNLLNRIVGTMRCAANERDLHKMDQITRISDDQLVELARREPVLARRDHEFALSRTERGKDRDWLVGIDMAGFEAARDGLAVNGPRVDGVRGVYARKANRRQNGK